jgi:hypothetical protein
MTPKIYVLLPFPIHFSNSVDRADPSLALQNAAAGKLYEGNTIQLPCLLVQPAAIRQTF